MNVSAIGSKNLHYSAGHHSAKVSTHAISDEYPVVDHSFDAIVLGAGVLYEKTKSFKIRLLYQKKTCKRNSKKLLLR